MMKMTSIIGVITGMARTGLVLRKLMTMSRRSSARRQERQKWRTSRYRLRRFLSPRHPRPSEHSRCMMKVKRARVLRRSRLPGIAQVMKRRLTRKARHRAIDRTTSKSQLIQIKIKRKKRRKAKRTKIKMKMKEKTELNSQHSDFKST